MIVYEVQDPKVVNSSYDDYTTLTIYKYDNNKYSIDVQYECPGDPIDSGGGSLELSKQDMEQLYYSLKSILGK